MMISTVYFDNVFTGEDHTLGLEADVVAYTQDGERRWDLTGETWFLDGRQVARWARDFHMRMLGNSQEDIEHLVVMARAEMDR